MNTDQLVEWQRHSPTNGMIQCWWTWPMLDLIETWDWKDKEMLEFGAGRGTAWLRDRCKWVDSIESNIDWAIQAEFDCGKYKLNNGNVYAANISDCTGEENEYFGLIPATARYDIISIDGIYRTEAIEWALNHFKGREGLLILDNLDQDYVWISPKAMELLEPYKGEVFIQPGHINHEGKPWNTRYYKIPA